MSWSLFGIALLVAYLCQAAFVYLTQLPINLFLVVALVFGMLAPRNDARIAGLFAGLALDIGGVGALGQHAFAFGLGVLLLTVIRESLRTNLWIARFIVMGLAAIGAEMFVVIHLRLWLGTTESWLSLMMDAAIAGLIAACIAATITALPAFQPARFLRRRAGR